VLIRCHLAVNRRVFKAAAHHVAYIVGVDETAFIDQRADILRERLV
jgi:hypothetical protein